MIDTAPVVTDGIGTGGLHPWIRSLRVFFAPTVTTPLLDEVLAGLRRAFSLHGHIVQELPTDETDLVFTTVTFGKPISWRESFMFVGRRKLGIRRSPMAYTLMQITPAEWQQLEGHFERSLAKEPPDPADYRFPGLAPTAYKTLIEQGRRGGPILAMQRMLQAQAMCLRLVPVIGEQAPICAYHFDLVGSMARSEGASPEFYDDIVGRAATAVCAADIGPTVPVPEMISRPEWDSLATPDSMRRAGLELGRRNFFTEMVRIADLAHVPAISDSVASQYSEGCFATWESQLNGLISTITGSARPVDKARITDDDLAVIVGVRLADHAVYVRHVEGLRNDKPSSEAFEMAEMDNSLPWITLDQSWGISNSVPVARSKLHGHRGVAAYDPNSVEYVPIGATYFHYPVTCGTQQQAESIRATFARSEALRNPQDPRQVAFTLLPTHGVFVAEKWVHGKAPMQVIWEAMDAGQLQITSIVPQGPEVFTPPGVALAGDRGAR
jgi:hypothetical protein